jgi:uncharacterized protein
MTAASEAGAPVTVLSADESWELLSGVRLGRLVTVVDGRAEIFPVNFVVQHRTVLFCTAEGTKLFNTVSNEQVIFEADDHNMSGGWSVIIRGSAEVLFGAEDVRDAEQAGLYSWIATKTPRFVRITPVEVTGRRFVFGPGSR